MQESVAFFVFSISQFSDTIGLIFSVNVVSGENLTLQLHTFFTFFGHPRDETLGEPKQARIWDQLKILLIFRLSIAEIIVQMSLINASN